MSFEDRIQQGLLGAPTEKTFIDKLLSRQDVENIRTLIKKPRLQREDLLELLYLLGGVESKLMNYSEWDRYIILKFFVWVREFCKVTELLFDYNDDLNKVNPDTGKPSFELTDRTRRLLDNVTRMMEHNVKFLVDLYLNIGRTSLSLGATGFMEILNNRYEISYPQVGSLSQQQDHKGGLLRMRQ